MISCFVCRCSYLFLVVPALPPGAPFPALSRHGGGIAWRWRIEAKTGRFSRSNSDTVSRSLARPKGKGVGGFPGAPPWPGLRGPAVLSVPLLRGKRKSNFSSRCIPWYCHFVVVRSWFKGCRPYGSGRAPGRRPAIPAWPLNPAAFPRLCPCTGQRPWSPQRGRIVCR